MAPTMGSVSMGKHPITGPGSMIGSDEHSIHWVDNLMEMNHSGVEEDVDTSNYTGNSAYAQGSQERIEV